jgi:hypothetical protein
MRSLESQKGSPLCGQQGGRYSSAGPVFLTPVGGSREIYRRPAVHCTCALQGQVSQKPHHSLSLQVAFRCLSSPDACTLAGEMCATLPGAVQDRRSLLSARKTPRR